VSYDDLSETEQQELQELVARYLAGQVSRLGWRLEPGRPLLL